jgi:hypothetical protein
MEAKGGARRCGLRTQPSEVYAEAKSEQLTNLRRLSGNKSNKVDSNGCEIVRLCVFTVD